MRFIIVCLFVLIGLTPQLARANNMTPLSEFIVSNDVSDSSIRAYVSFRCSGLFLYVAELTVSDQATSDKYRNASTNLFKAGAMDLLEKSTSPEKSIVYARDKVEQIRDMYSEEGEKNYNRTGMYTFAVMKKQKSAKTGALIQKSLIGNGGSDRD